MMLSLGSFPFLVEPNAADSTTMLLLHTTRTLKFTPKSSTASAAAASAAFSRGFGRGRLNHRCKHIRALGKNSETSEGKDAESEEDVLQATIEKSRKVLALQKELLQQVGSTVDLECVFLQKGF